MVLEEENGNMVLTVDTVDILRSIGLNTKTLHHLLKPGNYDDIEILGVDEDGQTFLIEELRITMVNPVAPEETFGE